jgi:hypothetical protein
MNTIVNEQGIILFEIFPNPSTGQFSIRSNEVLQNAMVQLMDLTGKVIYNRALTDDKQTISIDAGYLPHGMYIIRLQTDKKMQTGKVIIRH